MYYTHWEVSRNILIVLLLCFQICEHEPILKTSIYFYIVLALNYIHTGHLSIVHSFMVLAAAVFLDKLVALAGLVADFAQEIVPVAYRKFMLALILSFSVLK